MIVSKADGDIYVELERDRNTDRHESSASFPLLVNIKKHSTNELNQVPSKYTKT